MHKTKLILIITGLLFIMPILSEAQQRWMVYFKDKQHLDFNPYSYFDAKAIERRILTGIPLDDPSDWPVNESYVNQVTLMVNDVLITSRWFNSVAVDADDIQISNLKRLPFVLDVEWIEPSEMPITSYSGYDTAMRIRFRLLIIFAKGND